MAYYIYFLSLLITSTFANSLNETVPKSNNCYENGTYSRGTVIQVSVQTSPENCANHCITLKDCNYFTFDPIKQMCEAISARYYDGISTTYCPDCVSGRRDEFCGAHGYCKVHTTVPPYNNHPICYHDFLAKEYFPNLLETTLLDQFFCCFKS